MTGQLPEISSARLRLRRPVLDDALRITELAADFDVVRMTARMPHPYGEAHAREFLERVQMEDPRTDITWVMEAPGEGPIGVLALFTDGEPWPEIGYWIGRPFWGKGYASEALDSALRFVDTGWRKKVVVAGFFADNPASARVLEKAGFLHTGVVQSKFSLARGAEAPIRRMVRLG